MRPPKISGRSVLWPALSRPASGYELLHLFEDLGPAPHPLRIASGSKLLATKGSDISTASSP